MKRIIALCLLLTAPMAGAVPVAQTSTAIAKLEAGVVCPPPAVGTSPAPGTVAGSTHIIEEEPPFVSNSQRVPAVIGIGFGVKALATDAAGLDGVTIVVTHPAMGAGSVQSQQFTTRISGLGPSITFYQFDYAYELLPGPWQMIAVRDGQVLYTVGFEVVPPAAMPELAAVCGYEDLLS